MPPGFEDLNGVGLELVVSGKGLAEVHHPFGLLVAKRTATCRFSKLIAFLENLQAHFPPLCGPPPQFHGDDGLRDLEKDQIPILHVLPIVFEDMKILSGLAIFLQKQAIKGAVNFKEGKVYEVLGYAFNRQGFFVEGLTPYFMAPAGNAFFVSPLRINLPDPPGIPVTGRSN